MKKRLKESIFVSILIYVVLFVYLTSVSESLPIHVLVGTCPILLQIATIVLVSGNRLDTKLVWYSPIIFLGLFLFLWEGSAGGYLAKISGPQISILNLFMSYLITLIIYFIALKYLPKPKNTKHIPSTTDHPEKIDKVEYEKLLDKYVHLYKNNEKRIWQLNNELNSLTAKKDGDIHQIAQYYEHQLKTHATDVTRLKHEMNEKNKISETEYESLSEKYKKKQNDNHARILELTEMINNVRQKNWKRYINLQEKYLQEKQINSKEVNKLNKHLKTVREQLEITTTNFSTSLRSIEDKCKAINSVIGRVYSDRKGGSKELREFLAIERDSYNEFSEITKSFSEDNVPDLLKVLYEIRSKLKTMYKKEKQVLDKIPLKTKIKVKRDKKGEDPILLVLANNDKDPILYYYEEASEITSKLIKYLHENYYQGKI
ncbi:hypothetical protein HN587_00845 [Candidatus Woesearchaeota archaeon]|jgi:hypothetical protein|nr:hypothetical protein [Candidatus Woesearchaeota archaeon]